VSSYSSASDGIPFSFFSSPFHGTPRDAQLAVQLEFAPKLGAGDLPAQEQAVAGEGFGHFARCLVHELDPEMPQPQRQHPSYMLGAGLGAGVENRVPTTGIRLEDVLGAHPIAQLHFMPVARP